MAKSYCDAAYPAHPRAARLNQARPVQLLLHALERGIADGAVGAERDEAPLIQVARPSPGPEPRTDAGVPEPGGAPGPA